MIVMKAFKEKQTHNFIPELIYFGCKVDCKIRNFLNTVTVGDILGSYGSRYENGFSDVAPCSMVVVH
jgi:hypothetical protein